jgi:tryptophanyl-tRNA synthetase
MSIVTDSSGERPENVYEIHKNFRTDAELTAMYETNKGKYKDLKEALIADIESLVAPMRDKRNAISDEDVVRVLKAGSDKAREYASEKMADVRNKIGVAL